MKRITVEKALQSPFFEDVRNEECEVVTHEKFNLSFERELGGGVAQDKKIIRQKIYKEALLFL